MVDIRNSFDPDLFAKSERPNQNVAVFNAIALLFILERSALLAFKLFIRYYLIDSQQFRCKRFQGERRTTLREFRCN